MNESLGAMPDDWQRMLAIVAHPDDLEYGAASAIASWTAAGKWVGYVIVTDGEAGIDGLPPTDAAPIRVEEQRASARIVGVDDVTFLHLPDGALEYGFDLRRRLAREIRRHRPDVLLVANYDLTCSMGPGNLVVNQADHRAVGIATLDTARDAGNRWIFVDLMDEGFEPWAGVSHVYVMGSNQPTHAVDVSAGIDSLKAHATYIEGLGRDFDPEVFLRGMTSWAGSQLGVADAVAFGRVHVNGF